jgi:hypothetical protein
MIPIPRERTAAVVTSALALLLAGPAIVHAEPVSCRRTIAKEGGKFAQKVAKILVQCETAKVNLKHADPCPNPEGPEGSLARLAAERIALTRGKLEAKVAKKCGGRDRTCGDDLTGEDGGAALGWPAACPNFELGPCDNAIGTDDCTGIADCLACIHERALAQAMQLAYGSLLPIPAINRPQNTCQRAIGREAASFLDKKTKELQRCWDKRLVGKHEDACPDVNAPEGSLARKAAVKIMRAESKTIKRICFACGGGPNDGHVGQLVPAVSKKCDGDVFLVNPGGPAFIPGDPFGDDFKPSDLGFPAECPHVTVPGGPACYRPINTLVDMVQCVMCVAELKADCIDRAQVPQLASYPDECNPVPPTPTPTPTATPTETPSPTPSATPTGPTPTLTPTPLPTLVPCGDSEIFQCDGTCPPGQACRSIDLVCMCATDVGPCGAFGAPLCWGECPPEAPVCRDFNGICGCSTF